MKKLLIVAVILVVGWQYLQQRTNLGEVEVPSDWNQQLLDQPSSGTTTSRFSCDGRTHCSQMTSCEEATFFIENCLGTKMDGDRDGIPCEDQLCGH